MAKSDIPFDLFFERYFPERRVNDHLDLSKTYDVHEYAKKMNEFFDIIYKVSFEDLKSLTDEEMNCVPTPWLWDWCHCNMGYGTEFIQAIHEKRETYKKLDDTLLSEAIEFTKTHKEFVGEELQTALNVSREEFLGVAYMLIIKGIVQFRNNKYIAINKNDENLPFEMANVSKKDTGLPYDLWIDSMGINRCHIPQIKVKVDGKFIPMLISDTPDIPGYVRKKGAFDYPNINVIKKYVLAYKDVLLAHFNCKISDLEALNLLRTIKYAPSANEKLKAMLAPKKDGVIEYCWDEGESLFVIYVKDKFGQIVMTNYAFNEDLCRKDIDELKTAYEIERVVKKENKA